MLPCSRVQEKKRRPLKAELIANPQTLGHKIRNRRLKLRLTIKALAKRFDVSEELIVSWERKGGQPGVQLYPQIIEFLGYVPFDIDTSTLGGKVLFYRYLHGLTKKAFAAQIGIDLKTVRAVEENQTLFLKTMRKLNPLLREVNELIETHNSKEKAKPV